MNFVKRAFLYCFRQKVKTLILFLVLAVISTFLLTGLAIRDASEGATEDVQTAIGGKLVLASWTVFRLKPRDILSKMS